MTDVTSVTVAMHVGRPFELGRVGVSGADVAGLELLQLLLGAQFVGLGKKGLGQYDVHVRVDRSKAPRSTWT